MDALVGYEIYIPLEAEVRAIHLGSLPNSVLEQMGLPRPVREGFSKLAPSPEATWISPAVVRKRICPPANRSGDTATEGIHVLQLCKTLQTVQSPFKIPIVTSNSTVFRVLEDLPSRKLFTQIKHTSPFPHSSPPHTHRVTVIIYHGGVYLLIKTPKQVRGQRETHDPNPDVPTPATHSLQTPASNSPPPVPSSSASDSQKLSCQASPELTDNELHEKKRLLKRHCLTYQFPVMLPKMPQAKLKGLLPKTQFHSTREMWSTDEELLNGHGSKRKHDTCDLDRVSHTDDVSMNKETDKSLSKAACCAPQSSEGIHKICSLLSETKGEDPGEQQAEEQDARDSTQFQREEEEEEEEEEDDEEEEEDDDEEEEEEGGNKDVAVIPTSSGKCKKQESGREAESDVMDSNVQVDTEVDNAVDVIEDTNIQSMTVEVLPGMVFTSAPEPNQDLDFEQVAQEEIIACLRAKLRESEAALKNLTDDR